MTDADAVLAAWMRDLAATLGVDTTIEGTDDLVAPILDLARDAAHHVARPAAPLSTFLAGYAAGLAGGSRSDIADALATSTAKALRHDTIDP